MFCHYLLNYEIIIFFYLFCLFFYLWLEIVAPTVGTEICKYIFLLSLILIVLMESERVHGNNFKLYRSTTAISETPTNTINDIALSGIHRR